MKTVLITGCSSGLGFELVQGYLEAGWRVIATLRRLNERKHLFKGLQDGYPERLRLLELDVTRPEQHRLAREVIDQEFGGQLDVLVNNAGYGLFGSLEDLSETSFRNQVETNYLGPIFLTKTLLPCLRQTHGKVFQVSSMFAAMGFPLSSAYCGSKAALEGFSEALRYELQPLGVQVCIVQPGGHKTSFGRNSHWSTPPAKGSPYQTVFADYKTLQARLMNKKNMATARSLSKVILHHSHKPRIPCRVRVGSDCRLTAWVRKFLPEKLFHMGLERFSQNMYAGKLSEKATKPPLQVVSPD